MVVFWVCRIIFISVQFQGDRPADLKPPCITWINNNDFFVCEKCTSKSVSVRQITNSSSEISFLHNSEFPHTQQPAPTIRSTCTKQNICLRLRLDVDVVIRGKDYILYTMFSLLYFSHTNIHTYIHKKM